MCVYIYIYTHISIHLPTPGAVCFSIMIVIIITITMFVIIILFISSIKLLVVSIVGFPSGIIREHWNDTEKISMAPAQG